MLECLGLSRALEPGPTDPKWLEGFDSSSERLLNTLLQLGDGELPVISLPCDALVDGGANRWLGTIAGVATDVALGVARGDYHLVRSNGWIHVPAAPGREKWNRRDGDAANWLLDTIAERLATDVRDQRFAVAGAIPDQAKVDREVRRQMTKNVFVISPFVQVVTELTPQLKGYFTAGKANERIGTVHVTQGKEADIVVLVLGTAADAEGSRDWASERPNLLNVALTRAVKRIVIIGDYQLWGSKPGFEKLALQSTLAEPRLEIWQFADRFGVNTISVGGVAD